MREPVRIFLMWARGSSAGGQLDPRQVARSLTETLAPLFCAPLRTTVHATDAAAIVFLERPVAGWRAPFVQRDSGGVAFAVDYPVGVPRVLAACGFDRPQPGSELPALGRALAADPAPVLREVPPPFSLVWWPAGGEPLVQTDGLGRAQLLEYDDGAVWAVTNKVAALRALGARLELDPVDWAVKSAVGWFPMARTGYRELAYLAPGTQLRVGRDGVRRRVDDVLREWVHPPPMGPREALELGRDALVRHVRDGAPYFDSPAAGLTGGWDTRAVISAFVAAGVDVRAKVKGREGSLDVAIARRLAAIADLDLEVLEDAELPPEDDGELERAIRLALLWQGGLMWSENHKTFLAGDASALDRPTVNVMGQHGEIARGAYERRIKAWKATSAREYEERLVGKLFRDAPPGLRPDALAHAEAVVREAFATAARYDLHGLAALDFFHLLERTRRYSGASLSSQPNVVFTPFLDPDVIRAAFAYRAAGGAFVVDRRLVNPIHRFTIAQNLPAWADVEYEEDAYRAARRAARARGDDGPVRAGPGGAPARDYYDHARYWREVAGPLAERALAAGGAWTELFHRAAVRGAEGPAPVEAILVALAAESTAGGRMAGLPPAP
jgi:hypothetical protein